MIRRLSSSFRSFPVLLLLAAFALPGGVAAQEGGALEVPTPDTVERPATDAPQPSRESSSSPFPDRWVLPPNLPGREQAVVLVPGDPVLQDRVRVVHWPGGEAAADRVVRVLERNPYLPGLPPGVPRQAVFFLAPDVSRWNALTGGEVPHWGAGVAIPSQRRAVLPLFTGLPGGVGARDRTLMHEWAHLGLHDHLAGLRIPRWFDEGYAQWAARQWNAQEGWRLRVALARGGAPPLDSLTLAWPRDQVGAEVAYLLSATAIQYLVEGSGPRGMELFLERWQESGDFEESFRRTFGMTTGTFERLWLAHVKRRYGWLVVLSQSAVFWILLVVVLFLMGGLRRRHNRERMARLRAADPPDAPAWWEGPPTPPIGGYPSEWERWGRGGGAPSDDSDSGEGAHPLPGEVDPPLTPR